MTRKATTTVGLRKCSPEHFRALADLKEAQTAGSVVEKCARGEWKAGPWEMDAMYDDYRVKPEPETVYVIRDRDGDVTLTSTDKDDSESELDRLSRHGHYKPYAMKAYREVIAE
jgi:hypothetical protein